MLCLLVSQQAHSPEVLMFVRAEPKLDLLHGLQLLHSSQAVRLV